MCILLRQRVACAVENGRRRPGVDKTPRGTIPDIVRTKQPYLLPIKVFPARKAAEIRQVCLGTLEEEKDGTTSMSHVSLR